MELDYPFYVYRLWSNRTARWYDRVYTTFQAAIDAANKARGNTPFHSYTVCQFRADMPTLPDTAVYQTIPIEEG